MSILSVQSHVSYGHVGNAAAVFLLQRLGFEVWPVHTVQFSSHTGHGRWRGEVFAAEHIAEVLAGVLDLAGAGRCRALLSGYLGEAALGEAILEAVAHVRAANPEALYLCDPVIGDDGRGVFVRPGVAEFLREKAVPRADIVTPNRFELEQLTGATVRNDAQALEAARTLLALGPRLALVTSLPGGPGAAEVAMLAVTERQAWRVATPWLDLDPPAHGAGDATAALFLGHYLTSGEAAAALADTAASVHEVLLATRAAEDGELAVVAAQERLVSPRQRFAVERLD